MLGKFPTISLRYLQLKLCASRHEKYKAFLVEVDRLSIAMSVTKVVGDIPGSVQSFVW